MFTFPGKCQPIVVNKWVRIISESTYHSLSALPELNSTDVTLHTYTSESIVVLGSLEVDVSYEDELFTLPLIVVQGSGPSLLGRNCRLN